MNFKSQSGFGQGDLKEFGGIGISSPVLNLRILVSQITLKQGNSHSYI